MSVPGTKWWDVVEGAKIELMMVTGYLKPDVCVIEMEADLTLETNGGDFYLDPKSFPACNDCEVGRPGGMRRKREKWWLRCLRLEIACISSYFLCL